MRRERQSFRGNGGGERKIECHLARDGARDFHATVLEVRGRRRALPGALTNIPNDRMNINNVKRRGEEGLKGVRGGEKKEWVETCQGKCKRRIDGFREHQRGQVIYNNIENKKYLECNLFIFNL